MSDIKLLTPDELARLTGFKWSRHQSDWLVSVSNQQPAMHSNINHLPACASASRLRRFCMTTVRRKVSVLQISC